MDLLFLGIIIFLFILAVFDLSVGVSNDAVNFLNSAIGSKAASFKTVIIVAAAGVFIGAASSNGMMDIARHGIFRPEYFSFYDLICIFMAVMVTDIILLDVFNTLGMPTSTTVSMVFELLGAAFIIAIFKVVGGHTTPAGNAIHTGMMDLINTEKALEVILGIFLSVAIAFVFGTIVQFITRAIFSFEYRSSLKWKIGIFGGVATTAIIYFLLIRGVKDLSWLDAGAKLWIAHHTATIIASCLIFFTLLMQLLHTIGVNVLKVVVLIGTFALAMAFAGNDLVNFIGIPLSGYASYQDYMANGAGNATGFLMGSLNSPANTPLYFLLGAGAIMVVSLATSKKARNVTKTEIGLGSQNGGDEMFSSSGIARKLVRICLSIHSFIMRFMPRKMKGWLDRRFDTSKMTLEQGASFDLIRGAVNLTLAGMLIAAGTSMKLPLSTTFVTFMVAMGTSLADRAWSRESAVFRITGVISVIGGWFITAGVAFIGAALIAALMHWGGAIVMIAIAAIAVAIIIRSNLKFKEKNDSESADQEMIQAIFASTDKARTWELLKDYMVMQQKNFLTFASEQYSVIATAFIEENAKTLSKTEKNTYKEKGALKAARRRETICLRRIDADTAMEYSTWFHMVNNMMLGMNYNLHRMAEACNEHVGNNFRPLPKQYHEEFTEICRATINVLAQAGTLVEKGNISSIYTLRADCEKIRDDISAITHNIYLTIRSGAPDNLTVTYLYLHILQETQEFISSLRKLLRASAKLADAARPVRALPSPVSNAISI